VVRLRAAVVTVVRLRAVVATAVLRAARLRAVASVRLRAAATARLLRAATAVPPPVRVSVLRAAVSPAAR
jgi:hypothetical protein